jgi:hypothetical protein
MRSLIIANFERIEGTQFLVAILYGDDGHMLDAMTLPCDNSAEALQIVKYLAEKYRLATVEMWTSSSAIYVQSLMEAGVFGVIKHQSDTTQTKEHIEQDREILIELFAVEPLVPKPRPPRWRAFLVSTLTKLLAKIERNGKFEI